MSEEKKSSPSKDTRHGMYFENIRMKAEAVEAAARKVKRGIGDK